MSPANAPSKAAAVRRQAVKTRNGIRRRVLTWFASRWRNHQPKRAEKPHSKFNFARGWTALPRGRRFRLPRKMASGSGQPPRGERQMSARERETGELPPPICPCLAARPDRDSSFPESAPSPSPSPAFDSIPSTGLFPLQFHPLSADAKEDARLSEACHRLSIRFNGARPAAKRFRIYEFV